jgi:hypothetical protein
MKSIKKKLVCLLTVALIAVGTTITAFAAPSVTASGVTKYKNSANGKYYATGYVSVYDGSTAYYHYTRVEILSGSNVVATSGNVWGYGSVSATTNETSTDGTAKVFYGW